MARERLTAAVVVLLLLVAVGLGQSYLMPKSVIGSGGAPGAGASYVLNGTAGQAVQGTGAGSGYLGYWGFWYGMAPPGGPGDIGVTAIVAPTGFVDTMSNVTPSGRWHNYHSEGVGFTAYFYLESPTAGRIYEHTVSVVALASGADTVLSFPMHNVGLDTGTWVAKCSTAAAGDPVPGNDWLSGTFLVGARPPWPSGWVEVASMPLMPSGKPVKRGGWLEINSTTGLMYAQKGNKSEDFYSYNGVLDLWTQLTGMPYTTHPMWSDKAPEKGSKGCCDGDNIIYVTQGNNSLGFWSYHIEQDSWVVLPDVPLGVNRKKVKGGTDMYYVPGDSGDYLYLLKGYKNEFYRFDVAAQTWETLADAPVGIREKYDKGSWLCRYGDELYAHKAKYHELYAFDLTTRAWNATAKTGMPFIGMLGKKKKSKDGGSAALFADDFYCLKGGNTQEFWHYDPATDAWDELDTMPSLGSTGKKKRVKYGADIVSFGGGAFFALKGNKTLETWRYVLPAAYGYLPQRSGVMAEAHGLDRVGAVLAPNPMTGGRGVISYGLPKSGPAAVSVIDVTGRTVEHQSFIAARSGIVGLDLRHLATGVYLVRFETDGFESTQKLVLQD